MNKLGISETIWIIVTNVLFPILVLWVSEKVCRIEKLPRNKQVALYFAAIIAVLGAWFLAQLFLPLGFVSVILVPFLASWLVAKLSLKKSLLLTVCFSVVYLIIDVAATYAYIWVALNK